MAKFPRMTDKEITEELKAGRSVRLPPDQGGRVLTPADLPPAEQPLPPGVQAAPVDGGVPKDEHQAALDEIDRLKRELAERQGATAVSPDQGTEELPQADQASAPPEAPQETPQEATQAAQRHASPPQRRK